MPENTKESEAGVQTPATPAYAPFNDVEGSPNYSLFVDVYRFRVLFGSLIVGGILVGVMLPFASDGVRVRTFESTDMDAAEQKKMLDRYNSISGANTALLMKPVDVVLSMVISVAFLCLATKFSQLGERRAYLAMAAVAAVGYLMNTGLSSLNVQVISGDIHPRILAADLAEQSSSDDTAQQLSADGFVTTTWSHSFREDTAGNSVLNTIMRKLFVPTENVPTWCNHTDAFVSPFKNIAASYGFPSRSWQQLALSQALTPTASVAMPMNAATSDLPADYELLMNQSIATNLATYALIVSNSFLGWWSSTDEAWSIYAPGYVNRNQSIPLVMADYLNLTASSPDFLRNLHGVIVEYFEKAENASTTDELATMEFSHVDLAETVAFDAFAIEIPTQMIGYQEDNSSRSAGLQEYTADGSTTTVYPRVQALSICINDAGGEDLVADFDYFRSNEVAQACDQRSNTSMIIVSVGKRMEGDAFEDDPDGLAARVANARIVYSLTVGRLSWSLEDLSEVYDASCATGSGCSGVRFPLESSDQLLVGVSDIPMDLLSPINLNAIWFDVGSSQWTTLASTVEEARGAALRTDTTPMFIVLPRNFKTINSTLTEFMLGDGMKDCEVLIDNYLNHIEKNHLYIEHTLQPAYTAGLYYIFQNGMVQSPISANSSSSQQNSLQFAGNIQDMYVQVSIPTTNLLLALAGCALIVVCGITVVAIARRGKVIEHGSAATATEALTNSGKFPPLMLRLYLHDGVGGGTGPTLDSLRVEEVVFAHKEDEAQIFAVGQAISVEKSMCKVTLEP
ncbi:hypothetical protein PHYSODRAFT_341869 [Phytophthora sojae]|uniref:Uncharacterized protein n=1 Tax=Phytophthora sojae (strain P6497) TaxID=1094619 RepID=G5AEL3_PHYSP|nr:hypothetical protein PHYSODRAFT_341869 [Phytophthora sojae]EGZ05653.1 hypothetical protein PHYSODRAFT_341869 [Phytophthora sojae]|eukprot:XP_009538514.1 hypothetical protein PHYSODRAFT_341869 [Phytophthora sojae]